MSKTLEEIRKKLQALSPRRNSTTRDKSVYAHWNIPEGTSAILRFLPDKNDDNTFFWTERQIFKFPFPGIKGQDENKPIIVQVPCIEMWEPKLSCPVLNEVRPWWKDASLKTTASKYWVKRTYYMQGLVIQDPMNETDVLENPIRRFIIGPQIFAIIKAALLDPEMGPNSPVNYVNGRNFIVAKTSKGGYADYGTSKWSMKESAIPAEMQELINQYKLVDLATYLPKRPTPEQVAITYDMFQASLDGELYDPEKWAAHYKPFGFDSGTPEEEDGGEGHRSTRSVSTPAIPKLVLPEEPEAEDENDPLADVVSTPTAEAKVVPAAATAAPTTGKSPQEILAMLRNRNK